MINTDCNLLLLRSRKTNSGQHKYKMFQLLFIVFCFWPAEATPAVNLDAFYTQELSLDNDVSFCVRNIIEDIVSNDAFKVDVILLNADETLNISKLQVMSKTRFVVRTFVWNRHKINNRIYVTSAADFETFQNGMKYTVREPYFNARANFVIVLNNFTENYYKKMVSFLMAHNIYNVSILARDDNDHGIYSFQSPMQPCHRRLKLVKISHCSSYERGHYIFPKMKDIRGCKFQLLTYNVFPFINLDEPNEEGVEQRVFLHFEKYSGVKIDLIPYSRTDKLGRLVGNFTYTDILIKVLNNEAEGAVGSYFISSIWIEKYSYRYPLTTGHTMIVLPRADYEYTWHSFFIVNTWAVILVFSLFICFSIAAVSLSLFPSYRTDIIRDILIVFGYFLNKVTVRKFKSGTTETIIATSFLLTIFIIPYTLQAYMWSVQTHPVRGVEVKDYADVRGQLIATSEWGTVLTKNVKECESLLKCLKQVRDKKDKSYYTIATNEGFETCKWMIADEQCNLQVYKLKKPVIELMRTVYLRPGSLLLAPYNDFFFRVMSAGLIHQHYKELSYKELLKCKPQSLPSMVPLNLDDFSFAFILLLVGYSVSVAAFAYETFTRKC